MKKLFFIFALASANISFSQTYEVDMNDYYMSYAYSMDYETLLKSDFGVKQEDNFGYNRYIIDGTNMTIKLYTGELFNTYIGEKKLLSFKETPTQVIFSFNDVGSISGKTYIRYGVINLYPAENEPVFILYHMSKLDNKTTVCYTTKL